MIASSSRTRTLFRAAEDGQWRIAGYDLLPAEVPAPGLPAERADAKRAATPAAGVAPDPPPTNP
jgi:hypothetical protein